MKDEQPIEYEDIQGLLRFGHGQLRDSCFMILSINDIHAAGAWLQDASITTAAASSNKPSTATQIAFTPAGLRTLGLSEKDLNSFPDEYIVGMAGDEGRSRRLGDIGTNAPEHWTWGFDDSDKIHILLLLYAKTGQLDALLKQTQSARFNRAVTVLHTLPTDTLGRREPFGFVDGISQPAIDWMQIQKTDAHARDTYSNYLAPGEIVLGYRNEYGQFTSGPHIHVACNKAADCASTCLPIIQPDSPTAETAKTTRYDFGRNGSFLVLRQLEQDVVGFHSFTKKLDQNTRTTSNKVAALMVGRERDGTALVANSEQPIPGIPTSQLQNHFNYDDDPHGRQCPVSSHVRRSNPRTGDLPPGVNGFWSRIVRLLGFKRTSEYEDVIASSRFHRILRRGRTYGEIHSELNDDTNARHHASGLQFICLAANIVRQFEFVQSAWCNSSAFAGLNEQRDPLIAHRRSRANGSPTDSLSHPNDKGASTKYTSLPQFVTVRGGGYFFMPGVRAVAYLAMVAQQSKPISSNPTEDVA